MARRKVRVGIVGVGNCASSLVQGISYYAEATANEPPPGLMNVDLGGYHVSDIEIASAFDVHAGKVGRDVSEAILLEPNNTYVFAKPDKAGVQVQRGPTLDGIGKYLKDRVEESEAPAVDVAELGLSQTSSFSSTFSGTPPKVEPSRRMCAHLRSVSHGT